MDGSWMPEVLTIGRCSVDLYPLTSEQTSRFRLGQSPASRWGAALKPPHVKGPGLVIGGALLFPSGGAVAETVDQFVEVL